jgi:hypothetical protein
MQGYANFGFAYDSNVNLVEDRSLQIAQGVVSQGKESAVRGIFELGLEALALDTERLSLRVGYTGFLNYHLEDDARPFDIETNGLWVDAVAPLGDRLQGGVRYGVEWVWADFDSFRRTHAVEPWLRLRLHEDLSTLLFFSYDARAFPVDFVDRELDRDGNVRRYGIHQYWYLPDLVGWGRSFLRAGYSYRRENAQGNNYDSRGNEPLLTLGISLPRKLFLVVDGRYEWRDFSEMSVLDTPTPGQDPQEDRIGQLQIVLRRPLSDRLTTELAWLWVRRISNVEFFDYRRHVLSLLATVRF